MKKILCVLLIVLMCLTAAPLGGFAELDFGVTASALDATGRCGEDATYTFDSETGELVISGTGAIATEAFYKNQEIKDVIIEEGITEIATDSFCESSITSIDIGDDVKYIGESAFRNCYYLVAVSISDSVTNIGANAFSHCGLLKSLKIGASVKNIGSHAFYLCSSLIDVIIPDSVETIDNFAFWQCDNLTNLHLGKSLKKIGKYAFSYCRKLSKVIIPDTVDKISEHTFICCYNLNYVDVGDGVNYIGALAFGYCENLKFLRIGNGVTSIDTTAFDDCLSIQELYIGDSISEFNNFFNCSLLKDVYLGKNITTIGKSAFQGSDLLCSINIPKSVKLIDESAFRYCPSLVDVYYEGNEEEWNKIEIRENNTALKNATIHFAETHTHTWDIEEITKDPTCTEKGEKVIKCKNAICEKLEKIPATGHEWIHASCTTPKTCNKCGVTEGEALGHTFTEQKLGEKYLKTPATCGKAAVYYYSCAVCALSSGETNEAKTFVYGTAPDHNWGTAVKVEATCTEDEMMVQTCSRCNQKYVKKTSVKALGHSYGSDGKCKNAGCTETCPHSGKKETVYGKPATCTNPGVSDGEKCKDCGVVTRIQTVVPALGHKYANYASDNNATCIKDGTMTATCEICKTAKDTKTEVGSKERAGHTPDTDGIRCTLCGVELVCVHVYSKEKLITKVATCEENGQKAIVCSKCQAHKPGSEEVVPKLGHDKKVINTISATCIYEGYIVYTCSRCDIEAREKVPPLGHMYKKTTISVTCQTDGYDFFECQICGDSYKDNWVRDRQHNYLETKTEATCTKDGLITYSCKTCGTSKESEIIPALGHKMSGYVETKAPTCTEEGLITNSCSRCSRTVAETTPSTGHSYPDNWSVVIAPDCQNTGFAVKVCFSCHDVIAQKVPKAGHADLDGDSKCDTCEMIIVVEPEEPTEPDTPDIPDVPEEKPCDCDCHAGGIKAFFFNFLNFFAKLFDKSARVCKCGASH